MRRIVLFLLAAVLTPCIGTFAHAADPARAIPYSGRLEVDGQLPNASLPMTFTLFDALTGGAELFKESQTVPVTGGAFSVVLGADPANGLLDKVFAVASLFVEVQVDTTTLAPRQQILAAPMSVRASYKTFNVTDELVLGPGSHGGGYAFITGKGFLDLNTENGAISLMAAQGVFVSKSYGGLGTGNLTVENDVNAKAFRASSAADGKMLYGRNSAGDLHIDSGGATYLNFYEGNGIQFCNGAKACGANVSASGALTAKGATVNGDVAVSGQVIAGLVVKQCDGWTFSCECDPGTALLGGGLTCEAPTYVASSGPAVPAAGSPPVRWEGICTGAPDRSWYGQSHFRLLCARIK